MSNPESAQHGQDPAEHLSITKAVSQTQHVQFSDHTGAGDTLDNELWSRRRDRLDHALVKEWPSQDAPLASLVLALARLTAQRDAKLMHHLPIKAGGQTHA